MQILHSPLHKLRTSYQPWLLCVLLLGICFSLLPLTACQGLKSSLGRGSRTSSNKESSDLNGKRQAGVPDKELGGELGVTDEGRPGDRSRAMNEDLEHVVEDQAEMGFLRFEDLDRQGENLSWEDGLGKANDQASTRKPSQPLRIAWQKPNQYQPLAIHAQEGSTLALLPYRGLFALDKGANLRKDLLASYTWSEDHLILTLVPKPKVSFYDPGQKKERLLTSADIVASLILYRSLFLQAYYDLDQDFSDVDATISDDDLQAWDLTFDAFGCTRTNQVNFYPVSAGPSDLVKIYKEAPKVPGSNLNQDKDLLLLRKNLQAYRSQEKDAFIPKVQLDLDSPAYRTLYDLDLVLPTSSEKNKKHTNQRGPEDEMDNPGDPDYPGEEGDEEAEDDEDHENAEGTDEEEDEEEMIDSSEPGTSSSRKKSKKKKKHPQDQMAKEWEDNLEKRLKRPKAPGQSPEASYYKLYADKANHTALTAITKIEEGPNESVLIYLDSRQDHLPWALRFPILPLEACQPKLKKFPPGTTGFALAEFEHQFILTYDPTWAKAQASREASGETGKDQAGAEGANTGHGDKLVYHPQELARLVVPPKGQDATTLLHQRKVDLVFLPAPAFRQMALRHDMRTFIKPGPYYMSFLCQPKFLKELDLAGLKDNFRYFLQRRAIQNLGLGSTEAYLPLAPGSSLWQFTDRANEMQQKAFQETKALEALTAFFKAQYEEPKEEKLPYDQSFFDDMKRLELGLKEDEDLDRYYEKILQASRKTEATSPESTSVDPTSVDPSSRNPSSSTRDTLSEEEIKEKEKQARRERNAFRGIETVTMVQGHPRIIAPNEDQAKDLMGSVVQSLLEIQADPVCEFLNPQDYWKRLQTGDYDLALALQPYSFPINPLSQLASLTPYWPSSIMQETYATLGTYGLYNDEIQQFFLQSAEATPAEPLTREEASQLAEQLVKVYQDFPLVPLAFSQEGVVASPLVQGSLSPLPDQPWHGLEKLSVWYDQGEP